ncbi:MAG: DeoR/GlpR transcriptional regulator [Clostridia bacterium]|jgi:DeoR/GlpR family transcriptional regulator of sugar metabolism|nr:DeoR/GlpR transcriptional regulator [Clostridia bacterium]
MKKTLADENVILKEMQLSGSVTLKSAMDKLSISEATARRLFTRMEEKGLGIRSHGKITMPDSAYNFYRYDVSKELYVKEKKAIANHAVSLVKSGDVLFLDSGTTVCLFSMALADALRQNILKDIKVFTNSYMIINVLNDLASVNLIGGTYRPNRKDFCGYMTEKSIKDCHFDKCFLGTDGYTLEFGFTTTEFESAKICETAIASSDNAIILTDFHKFGASALVSFSNGENLTAVLTDDRLPQTKLKELMGAGINVIIAKND